ncbi:hypothetical protein [Schinkia azotoformans]|uniref:hypothetical protein n=1 Tax=Schinkia azotoformans TaxID=1454 RepID=UPI002DBBA16E|nr:hypothetical protein [Schinkia azotoformans]MEC1718410.1 hypothetical protein [Schinkia azotoformans]MEC1756231.1 hypothetical protein [Schinkia azotoformans]
MEIQQLTEVFHPAKWVQGKNSGEGWFLLEINPLPPEDQIELVVSDIESNKRVFVGYETGKLYHSEHCASEEAHTIDERVKKALKLLQNETFKVVVLPKSPELLATQPVAIAVEPEINYFLYPDHPHLNEDGTYNSNFYFPHSFCYKHDHLKFREGKDLYARVLDAFEQISIWLFRHQVWVATRKLYGKGIWIGKGTPPLPDENFPRFLNAESDCRCGNKVKYKDCHMKADLYKRVDNFEKHFDKQHIMKNWVEFQRSWYDESLKKNNHSMQLFKKAMM